MLDDSAVVSAVQSQEWERERESEMKAALQVLDDELNTAAHHSVRGLPPLLTHAAVVHAGL